MNYLQTFKEIPTKTEIAKYANQFIEQGDLSLTEKFINIKFAEELIEQIKKQLNPLAKEDFAKMFQGETKMDFMGVTVQLVYMGKSKAIKDPYYLYPEVVTKLQDEIEQDEIRLKDKREVLKVLKIQAINNGTAKKLDDIFEEPKNAIDDFTIKVTLRK